MVRDQVSALFVLGGISFVAGTIRWRVDAEVGLTRFDTPRFPSPGIFVYRDGYMDVS